MSKTFEMATVTIVVLGVILVILSLLILGVTSGFFMGIIMWIWGIFVWWGLTFISSPLWCQVLMVGVTLFGFGILSVIVLVLIDGEK